MSNLIHFKKKCLIWVLRSEGNNALLLYMIHDNLHLYVVNIIILYNYTIISLVTM